jgi:putative ABC transport system permease protein
MIRQAIRRLSKSPLSLLAALAAFALGIGVNTAMYSICDAIVFRPVDLDRMDQAVVLEAYSRGRHEGIFDTSPADFLDFQRGLAAAAELGFAEIWDATITRDGEPEQVDATRVSANWLSLLGIKLVNGRGFLPGEDAPGRDKVAVIGYGLAERRFGGAGALGKKIRLNGEDYLVVGITKQESRFPSLAQVFVPYAAPAGFSMDRNGFRLMAAAVPRPGVSLQRLQAELDAIAARIAAENPKTHAGRTVLSVPLRERVASTNNMTVSYTTMLLYATGFVLLLACANVANLQLARATGRAREFAIRSALGASRWRIARDVLVESTLLSVAGALFGCFFAVWAVDAIKQMLPGELWVFVPMWRAAGLNWFALGVTILLSVSAGVLTGVLPAWSSSLTDAQETLKDGGRAMSSGTGRQWFRASMVAFQMMVALVLLIGAGLMVRGTRAVFERFSAHEPSQVATLETTLPATKYPEATLRGEYIQRLESELGRLPGRGDFGLVNIVPLTDDVSLLPVVIGGRQEPPAAERPRVSNLIVSPGFFPASRVPLRQGRFFSSSDGPDTESVCAVDEMFAQRFFPRENPLGQRVSLAATEQRSWCRVVGVVGTLAQTPWEREPLPTLYRAMAQVRPRRVGVVLRTSAPMDTTLRAMQQAVAATDPEQPVKRLKSQDQVLATTMHGLQLVSSIMVGIGLIALVLSAVGVYSVVSYVVSERTSEIGMRVAMGATERDVFTLVSKQTMAMCAAGLFLGLVAGYGLARAFSGLIWGVSASDFWSLASVSLLLAMVGATAMYLPARRAMRMDPVDALRHE